MTAGALKVALPELLRPHVVAGLPDGVAVRWFADGAAAAGAVGDSEVLYVHFWPRPQLEAAITAGHSLRWIQASAAGVDLLPLDLIRERGIMLTGGAGLYIVPMGEFVVMCMLAAAKDLPALVRAHDRREWLQAPSRRELHDSRALVLGYGAIGRAVAKLLAPFGVEVTGVRRHPDGEPGVLGPEDWRQRLPEFDWVIVAAAATDETRHIIGAAELDAMKSSAWLLNVARGSLVDEAALVQALRAEQIAGAYLDVTATEPLPPESPLWRAPNTIVTSHSSGPASTRIAERAGARLLENLGRYRRGEELVGLVDFDRGY
jgi:phosphoglycerate dehydrogenase-like enzyme